jgi:uncharacterized Zn-finger protein
MPETIIYTTKDTIACSGENNDHPRVWYNVPATVGDDFVECGYCGIKFARGESNEHSSNGQRQGY